MSQINKKEYFSCTRGGGIKQKKKYNSKAVADRKIKEMTKKGIPTALLKSYECPYCNKWHIGNDKGKRK